MSSVYKTASKYYELWNAQAQYYNDDVKEACWKTVKQLKVAQTLQFIDTSHVNAYIDSR